jgi:hypothetical protein
MSIRVSITVLLAACVMLIAAGPAGSLPLSYVSGVVYAAAFVPFLLMGAPSGWKRFLGIWCAMAVAASFCTWTEYVIFVHASRKERITALVGGQVVFAVFSALLTFAAKLLKVGVQQNPDGDAVPARRIIGAIFGGGVVYLVCYYVFGALVFQLLTKPYYSGGGRLGGAVETVAALGWWFPLIQVGRGMLMSVAVMPVLLWTRLPRLQLAVYGGLVLWAIGGLAPLIPPVEFVPPILRAMHIGEIFTQNFPLGFCLAFLLMVRKRVEAPVAMAAGRG